MGCIWEQTSAGHVSECGHTTKNRFCRNYIYCPYCGKEIIKSRKDYQHKYYEVHKGQKIQERIYRELQ